MRTTAIETAKLAIQCDVNGRTGTFLYREVNGSIKPVSPIARDMADLSGWLRVNRWRRLPYNPVHPAGVYVRD